MLSGAACSADSICRPASTWLPVASGIVEVSLGAVIGTGTAGAAFTQLRLAHSHLNLVGLVGLTIIGTIPTLLPTTAYRRAVSGREAIVSLWFGLGGAFLIGVGIWRSELVGVGTILVGLSGGTLLTGILVRIWEEGRRKLAFLQITAGMTWLVAWALSDGIQVASTGQMRPFGGWTGAAVIAGVGSRAVHCGWLGNWCRRRYRGLGR